MVVQCSDIKNLFGLFHLHGQSGNKVNFRFNFESDVDGFVKGRPNTLLGPVAKEKIEKNRPGDLQEFHGVFTRSEDFRLPRGVVYQHGCRTP